METSIIIAQILGICFTVMGLSLFINKKTSVALLEEATKNTSIMWLFGFVSLMMGAIIVTFNNSWGNGLELSITIVGWLALLKGIAILVFPESTASLYKGYKKNDMLALAGAIVLIMGLILLYNGF